MALIKNTIIIIFIILSLMSVFLFYSPVSASNFAIWNALNGGTTKDLYGLWGANNTDVFIVGQSGTIRYYDGSAWSSLDSNTTNNLRGIWGIDNSDVFAVGDSGTILHYDGSTWSQLNSGTTHNLNSIWGTSDGSVFAVGQAGTILHYDGNIWNFLSSSITEDLNCIWGIDDRDIFAVGNSGTILHYNGNSWTSLNSQISGDLMGIWGSGSSDVFAVGDSGAILHYDGDIWVSQNSFTPSNLNCIWGTDANHVFVVGESGTIAYFDGLEFSSMNRNTSDQLFSVWGSSSIDVFAVGRSGTVLRYLPPVISSISPGLGNQGETLDITLNGNNLFRTSEVKFGTGIAVNSFTIQNSTRITANITIVSSASIGTRDVSVITPGGSFTLPASFVIQQSLPAISSVSPDKGRQNTTININLTGINLSGITKIQFGAGISVNSFNVLSSNQITVNITILADADSGSRDISVTTSGGSFTLPESFTIQPALPLINSISPNQGNRESTFAVIINGNHLNDATKINFGTGITVNNFTVLSSNQISAGISLASNASIGTRDVSITTPGGSFTLPDGFTVKQALPSIASLNPDHGSLGATLPVTITGANLNGTSEIRLGTGIVVNSFTVVNSQQVKAEITILSGLETGARDVSITTSGGSFILSGGFTVSPAPPVLTSLNLNQGRQGSALTVIINGSNLDKTSSVSFGPGVLVQRFTNLSPTQLSVNIMIDEDAVTGLRDVSVTTPGGTSSLSNGFTIQEKSTATLFIALLWVVIALAIALFVLLLNLLRKKRAPKA